MKMNQKKTGEKMKLTILLFLNLLIGQLSIADEHTNMNHNMHDMPSTHGMFLFGTNKIYLSHLPMFHTPHDYQVIFEVEIPNELKEKYLSLVKENPEKTIFTIIPESFVLPELVQNPKPFKAQLFFGHFERGGQSISPMVEFKIKEIVYFKKFTPNATQPKEAQYILIGNSEEQFLIHEIYAKPDFDQILQIEIESQTVIEEISKTNHISLEFHDVNNTNPLLVGQSLFYKDILSVSKPLYLEFGDLSF
jgi:hypothetical protein